MANASSYSGSVTYAAGTAGQALATGSLTASFTATSAGWTIEGWVKYASTGSSMAFFGWGTGGGWLGVNGAGNIAGNFGGTGVALSTGVWHHVAITGNGSVNEFWIDGTYITEVADSTTNGSIAAVYMGGRQATGSEWVGGVDDVRVSSGIRYAAYNNFSVPSAPLTVDGTTRGLWHLDGDGTDSVTGGSSGGSSGGGSSSGGSSGSTTYTASTSVIPNPERGYFYYTETHYNPDGSGHVALTASSLTAMRTGTASYNGIDFVGRTLIFRYFVIEKYKTVATIDQAYLDLVAADLAAVRSAGCKIILRFSYYNNQSSDSDATPAYVRGHIQQLAPTLNQYADVIHAVQAGFIGAWGEWYYTNNFGDSGTLTSQNISDRNSVIDALLTNLDSNIFVLLRYMGTRQTYLNSTASNPGGAATRLGHHNDAFLASYADYGTYTTFSAQSESFNRSYLDGITNVPVGGESANYNPPNSDWANASVELAAHKFSFLNPNYYGQTINAWGQANNDTVSKNLGYRLRLVNSTIPATMAPGSTQTVQVVVTNDGWNAPVRNRPVKIVLDDGSGHTATTTVSTDIRTWTPGNQVTLSATITAPSTTGTYASYLVLPDASSAIATNPLYNIQMANTGTWDSSTGRNNLLSSVAVSGSSSSTPAATLSGVSTTLTLGASVSGSVALSNIATAYVVLYKSGAEQGARVSTTGGTLPTLTPSSAGSYTVRVFTAASAGTLLTESSAITVSSSPPAGATSIKKVFKVTVNGTTKTVKLI